MNVVSCILLVQISLGFRVLRVRSRHCHRNVSPVRIENGSMSIFGTNVLCNLIYDFP